MSNLASLPSEEEAKLMMDQIDRDFEPPLQDKSFNSLMLFQFDFSELKSMMEFLFANQKKQQFLLQQLLKGQGQS